MPVFYFKYKKLSQYFYYLLCSLLLPGLVMYGLTACNQDNEVNPDYATLLIKVQDEKGNAVAGANIRLYNSQQDLDQATNMLDHKSSDGNGEVLFKQLSEKSYHFSGEKNQLYGQGASAKLNKGTQTTVTLILR